MKFLKILILLAIPLGLWLFIENFPSGYYLDQTALPYKLYVSFFSDLAMPFGLYFVLCLFEKWIPWLKSWQAKTLLVFLLPTSIEIGQFIYQKLELTRILSMYGGLSTRWILSHLPPVDYWQRSWSARFLPNISNFGNKTPIKPAYN